MNDTELAIILFKAFAENDLEAARSLCHPDMKAIQNNNPAMDLDTLLGFWEAGDKVGYQVGQGAMNEATGIQVIRALLGRLDRTWQEGPGD